MADSQTASARTEMPTARRLRRARESGELAPSPALVQAAALAAVVLVVDGAAAAAWRSLAAFMRDALAGAPDAMASVAGRAARLAALMIGVPLMAGLLAALGVGLAQTRGRARLADAVPDLGRLFARADASSRRASAVTRAVEPLGLAATMALAAGLGLWRWLPALARRGPGTPGQVLTMLVVAAVDLGGWLLLSVAALAVGQAAWWRMRQRTRLMMTRDEVRRELRDLEGDPGLKRERRRRASAAAMAATTAAPDDAAPVGFVARAVDCVVLGSSSGRAFSSVALRYRAPADAAPVVVARAEGDGAARMAEQALGWGVPCREDAALARALLAVPLGAPISAALHEPVARFLSELGVKPRA
jgi:flagellar biosynthesis protein FlhB